MNKQVLPKFPHDINENKMGGFLHPPETLTGKVKSNFRFKFAPEAASEFARFQYQYLHSKFGNSEQ
jgi:hypothetical protein